MALTTNGVMLTGFFTNLQGKFGDVAISGMFSSAFTANYETANVCGQSPPKPDFQRKVTASPQTEKMQS